MQQRQSIACDNGNNSAQWICINHKTFICDNCRKDHENCFVLTIYEFHLKFSDLIRQRSQQIDEIKQLFVMMNFLKCSSTEIQTKKQIMQELDNICFKIVEKFNYDETKQTELRDTFYNSLKEFERLYTKEKLKAMLKYIELKDGNIILINDFGAFYQQLKQQLNEYINDIKDHLEILQRIIQQKNDQQQHQQEQQNEIDSQSDSSSSDQDNEQQFDETKKQQCRIDYESPYSFLIGNNQIDLTTIYQQEQQKIKFLLEIRDNYVIAASNIKVFLIQLQPPVVKDVHSFRNNHGKITSISKFQNSDQNKFITAHQNGKIQFFDTIKNRIQESVYYNNRLLDCVEVSDQPGRLLIGLSENILVTVGGNNKIRFYKQDQGEFEEDRIVGGRNFIRRPPRCLLVLNDNINFIAVAGAGKLFIIKNQKDLVNFGDVDQTSYVRFLGYSGNRFLLAVTNHHIYIYDLLNNNKKILLNLHNKISFFQAFENNCLVNCNIEAQVNEFQAYQIPIRGALENIKEKHLEDYRNRNIKLAKLQEINQRLVFQIFIVDNLAVRKEAINI